MNVIVLANAGGEGLMNEQNRTKARKPEHNSYFIRHTKVAVSDDVLEDLWDQDKVAIHFPGAGPGPDLTSLDPQHYEGQARTAIKNFATLAEKGGYV